MFSWFLAAAKGLLIVLVAALILGAIYTAFLYLIAVVTGRSIKDLHDEASVYISDAYANSAIGDAITVLVSAFGSALLASARGIALPFRLLGTSIESLVQGPVEEVLDKFEDRAAERQRKHEERKIEYTKKHTKRLVNRQIEGAKLRRAKEIAREARRKRLIPDFSELSEELDRPTETTRASEKENGDSPPPNPKDIRAFEHARAIEAALRSGEMSNPSIKSIKDFLGCSETDARSARKLLREAGVVEEFGNGQLRYSGNSLSE